MGSSIVQFAAAAGVAQIIAIDVNDDKLKAVAELGATHTVNSRDTDVVAEVRALTDGHGVDVAFEALGHPSTFATALDILDDGGRAVVVGIAPAGTPGELDLARLVRRSLQIRGSYSAKARRDMPALLAAERQAIEDIARLSAPAKESKKVSALDQLAEKRAQRLAEATG